MFWNAACEIDSGYVRYFFVINNICFAMLGNDLDKAKNAPLQNIFLIAGIKDLNNGEGNLQNAEGQIHPNFVILILPSTFCHLHFIISVSLILT